MLRAGLIEKMTFEQNVKEVKELIIQPIWEKRVPGRGNSQCQGPKAERY